MSGTGSTRKKKKCNKNENIIHTAITVYLKLLINIPPIQPV